ncbi:MAG: SAM-dependent methyltransferase [Deltaproteobacteria bacterium]|nr:MAG: SAM-dependent methyltransferase [Deltaproteobacteria bacterium]PIE75023.1 MAG: SAM-dependent methyltransferase [Deltaproteobacteria bacterium]
MPWDNTWEGVFASQDWGRYPGEDIVRFIAINFYKRDRKKVKILEVGCGPCTNLWYIGREGFNVYGVDGSKTAIEKGKKRLSENGIEHDLIVGDIEKLPYENDFFDGILDVECLCCNNFYNSTILLNEIHRVLKVGGLFYSRTFSDKSYVGRENKLVGDKEYIDISDGPLAGKGFVRLSNKDDIARLYGKSFEIMSIDRLFSTRNNMEYSIDEYCIVCRKVGS